MCKHKEVSEDMCVAPGVKHPSGNFWESLPKLDLTISNACWQLYLLLQTDILRVLWLPGQKNHHPPIFHDMAGYSQSSLPCQDHHHHPIFMGWLDILNPIHLARAISSRFESRAARVVDSTITSKSKIMSTKHFEIHSSMQMIGCNSDQFLFSSAPEIVCQ